MNKAELRRIMKETLAKQPSLERERKSKLIVGRLVSLGEYSKAKTILTYVSMDEEVSTRELIPRAISDGKCVVVPAVSHDEKTMTLHEIKSPEELGPGYRGINEPKNRGTCFECERIDLAIVPGLAFDKRGNRLGRGKGMFDKLFAAAGCIRIALAFDFQVVGEVPVEAYDVPVHFVVSENRILKVGR